MLRNLPIIVRFVFISLIGVEIALFVGFVHTLQQSPLPVGELGVYFFLLLVCGLMLVFIAWLGHFQKSMQQSPLPGLKKTEHQRQPQEAARQTWQHDVLNESEKL